jgi:hypothetical protein
LGRGGSALVDLKSRPCKEFTMINGMTKLLGELVDGVPSVDGLTTSWTVAGGPYKAIITEWTFEDKKHYRYELRVGGLLVLSQSTNRSTNTIEEAVEKVEDTLRDYLMTKAIIERRFGPGSNFPNSILEYQLRSNQPKTE